MVAMPLSTKSRVAVSAGFSAQTQPDTASDPQVRTGRPDAFTITVGGKSVPRLAENDAVVSDVPVNAKALLARDGVGLPGTAADDPAEQGGPGGAQR